MTKTQNASKAKTFHSSDFVFRPTTLSAAMAAAGILGDKPLTLVRESKLSGLLRARSDKNGTMPSISVDLSAAA